LDASKAAGLLGRLREARPLVQNITNYVSMDIMANALLAAGASPAMVHAPEEAADFAAIAGAVSINIGTLSAPWVASMLATAERATALGKPWVLDPVGAGATRYRDETAAALARLRPTAIRANASEVLALAQGIGTTRGVDSAHGSEQAVGAARVLARETGSVVAVTGRVDYVTDGTRVVVVANGHPTMTLVTAVGCSVSALAAAFLSLGGDPVEATAAALAFAGVAGDVAGEGDPGPGTFRLRWIDALHALTPAGLEARADIGLIGARDGD
jgi:hydroxyethylthiazole kinase